MMGVWRRLLRLLLITLAGGFFIVVAISAMSENRLTGWNLPGAENPLPDKLIGSDVLHLYTPDRYQPRWVPDPLGKSNYYEDEALREKVRAANRLDLIDLLPFADLYYRGIVLSAERGDFQTHSTNCKWEIKQKKDRKTVAILPKKNGQLSVFLPKSSDYLMAINIAENSPGEKITLKLGDFEQTLNLDRETPAAYWVDWRRFGDISGYQRLQIDSESRLAISDIRFQPVGRPYNVPNTEVPPRFPAEDIPFQDENRLVLPEEGGAVFHLFVPDQGRLIWREMFKRSGTHAEPLIFLVRVVGGGKEKTVFVQPYSQSENMLGAAHAVDLRPYAGKMIRLEFWTTGGFSGDQLVLDSPRIVKTRPQSKPGRWIPPKNVIVFLSDTLRWDRIHFNKPDSNPIVTPNFDRIAAEGITFTNAISQGNWSKPSQAAIQTGRYPFDTHMEKPRQPRTSDTVLIAKAIEGAKPEIVTASYSSNGYVSSAFGFDQPWDYSRNMIRENLPNRTEYLLKAMKQTWEQDSRINNPFFIWLGTIDPHVAYNPRPSFLALYDDQPYHGIVKPYKTAFLLLDISRGKVQMSDRDWSRLLALYNGEVSYNDDRFGLLLEQLEEWGIADETAVILVSDHGDEFLEHGGMGHGHSLYDELVHVPMIIYYPRGFSRPRVVKQAVETMGIYPTVMEMLGVEIPEKTQAESLIGHARGISPIWPRPAISYQSSRHHLVAVDGWRYMNRNGKEKLFDTDTDPYEKKNLVKERPDVLYLMRKFYSSWFAKYRN